MVLYVNIALAYCKLEKWTPVFFLLQNLTFKHSKLFEVQLSMVPTSYKGKEIQEKITNKVHRPCPE